MVRVSRKVSLNESLECGCLSQATKEKSLEASVWVLLMYALRERGGEDVG